MHRKNTYLNENDTCLKDRDGEVFQRATAISTCLLAHVCSGLESKIGRLTSVASYKVQLLELVLLVANSNSVCKAL